MVSNARSPVSCWPCSPALVHTSSNYMREMGKNCAHQLRALGQRRTAQYAAPRPWALLPCQASRCRCRLCHGRTRGCIRNCGRIASSSPAQPCSGSWIQPATQSPFEHQEHNRSAPSRDPRGCLDTSGGHKFLSHQVLNHASTYPGVAVDPKAHVVGIGGAVSMTHLPVPRAYRSIANRQHADISCTAPARGHTKEFHHKWYRPITVTAESITNHRLQQQQQQQEHLQSQASY